MKITKLLKWRLLTIGSSLLFVFLIFKVITPAYSIWFERSEEISNKKKQIRISTNWQQELVKLQNEKNRFEAKYTRISQKYGILNDLSDAITLLNETAEENNITILDLHNGAKTIFDDYKQMELSVDIEGSFNNVGYFAKALEEKQNPIQFTKLAISNNDNNLLICSLNITLTMERS